MHGRTRLAGAVTAPEYFELTRLAHELLGRHYAKAERPHGLGISLGC
jgi:hypothetical protein